MALEDKITELTAAVAVLTSHVTKLAAAFAGSAPVAPPAEETADEPAPPKTPAKTADKAAPAKVAGKKGAAAPAATTTGPTAEDVRDAVFKVKDTVGLAEAQALVKTHGGATKLGDVKPEKFAALHAAAVSFLENIGAGEDEPVEDESL